MHCVGVRRCIRKTRGWDARQISLEWDSLRGKIGTSSSHQSSPLPRIRYVYVVCMPFNVTKIPSNCPICAALFRTLFLAPRHFWSKDILGPKTSPALRQIQFSSHKTFMVANHVRWFCTRLEMHSMLWISDWLNWCFKEMNRASQLKFCLPNPIQQNCKHALITRSWLETTLEY